MVSGTATNRCFLFLYLFVLTVFIRSWLPGDLKRHEPIDSFLRNFPLHNFRSKWCEHVHPSDFSRNVIFKNTSCSWYTYDNVNMESYISLHLCQNQLLAVFWWARHYDLSTPLLATVQIKTALSFPVGFQRDVAVGVRSRHALLFIFWKTLQLSKLKNRDFI